MLLQCLWKDIGPIKDPMLPQINPNPLLLKMIMEVQHGTNLKSKEGTQYTIPVTMIAKLWGGN
jgi:hypothetical protein